MEREPQSELDSYYIGDRSLNSWHDYLTHEDIQDGMPTGHLRVPVSRYGHTVEVCSWWAIAAEVARVQAIGEPDDPQASIDEAMGFIVNDDNGDAAGLIAEYWDQLPRELQDRLGTEDDVRRLDG